MSELLQLRAENEKLRRETMHLRARVVDLEVTGDRLAEELVSCRDGKVKWPTT